MRIGLTPISIPGITPIRRRTRSTPAGCQRPPRSVCTPSRVSSAAISRRGRAAPISRIVEARATARRWAAAFCSAALVIPQVLTSMVTAELKEHSCINSDRRPTSPTLPLAAMTDRRCDQRIAALSTAEPASPIPVPDHGQSATVPSGGMTAAWKNRLPRSSCLTNSRSMRSFCNNNIQTRRALYVRVSTSDRGQTVARSRT
jgi:hypothetical protein